MDFEAQFREIANGNPDAYEFMRSLFEFVHCWDDLYDRDKPVEADFAAMTLLKFIATLTNNEFYRLNAFDLLQSLHTACFSWAASERLRTSNDFSDKVACEVLKSGYIEVFFRVAFLVGGSAHQLAMDKKYRGYSFG
jgi:hypothetical protein